jgi:hypothetical protein
MLTSARFSGVLAVACALALPLSSAPASRAEVPSAGPPATVTVRVEGLTRTLLPATQVTTSSAPVGKDGNEEHACSASSAAGALQLATAGMWSGAWFSGLGYTVETVEGESHVFEPGAPANYFWTFWIDDSEASEGICGVQVHTGDRLLFFPSCFGSACPPSPTPLEIEAPPSVEAGAPFSVTVKGYEASGKAAPVAGAAVLAEGMSVITDAAGHGTLTLATVGESALQVSAPNSLRTEATVCVHHGNDGRCGTSAPPGAATSGSAQVSASAMPSRYTGPYAVVARISGLLEHHTYRRGKAPRLLAGTISAHTTVTGVSISLRGSHRGRCFAYGATVERLHRARCGSDQFFAVSSAPAFSYLLPFELPPGRYVLDIAATDAWGNHATLARGTSRIVFYVA